MFRKYLALIYVPFSDKKMNAATFRFFFSYWRIKFICWFSFSVSEIVFPLYKRISFPTCIDAFVIRHGVKLQKSKRKADESPRPKGSDFLLISYLLLFPSQPSFATCDSCMMKFSRKEEATFGSWTNGWPNTSKLSMFLFKNK